MCSLMFRDDLSMSSDLTIYLDNSMDTDATNLTETAAIPASAGPEIVITSSPPVLHRRLTATYSAPPNFGHRAPTEPNNKVQI